MKIVIDNSNLFAGGGIQVASSFLKDLNSMKLSYEFHVIQSLNSSIQIDSTVFSPNFYFYELKKEDRSVLRRVRKLKRLENLIKPDLIFTVFGPSYHKSNFPKIVGFAIPYIIYPNSPFFNKLSIKDKLYYKMLKFLKTYCFKKYSDALIFETQNAQTIFSKIATYDKPSFVVGNTLNEIFCSRKTLPDFNFSGFSTFNILFLTANYSHKNMDIVPEVIRILKEVHNLSNFKFLITLNKEELQFPSFCDEHISYLGKVNLDLIPSLYSQVQMVFIPTLLEVFSATYLEAMYMKKPIIASDLGFSRDICGDAAIFCEATNPISYADAIAKLAYDSNLQNHLIESGLKNLKRFGSSLERTQAYLTIIQDTIATHENTK